MSRSSSHSRIFRWLVVSGILGSTTWFVMRHVVSYVPEVRDQAWFVANVIGIAGVLLLIGALILRITAKR